MKGFRSIQAAVFPTLVLSAAFGTAYAQSAPKTDDDPEIVVTAQRRAQTTLDVPISVSAVSGGEIEARGVSQLKDLQYAVPGLVINDRGPGTFQIALRGVSQFVGAPTIGTYLDELSIAPAGTGASLSPQLIDLDRVEVLRGPQPSLYGESSMGGTIRYITADPKLDAFSGQLGARSSHTQDGDSGYRADGIFNAPLVNGVLGLRLAGAYEKAGGWIDTSRGQDTNEVETSHIRGKLLFMPTPRFKASLLGLRQEVDEKDSTLSDANGFNPSPGRAPSTDNFSLGQMILAYDFGPATLTSITGTIDRDLSLAIDQSAFTIGFSLVPLEFGGLGLAPGAITSAVVFTESEFERTSQEVRLTSNGSGPLTYLIGATYIDDELNGRSFSVTAPTPTSALLFDLFFSPTARTTSEYWTVYGDFGYQLTERLTAKVGARYFEDERTTRPAPTAPTRSATFESFNPSFTLSYDFGDGLLYGTAAKGFRSGGFNNPNVPPGTPIPPPNFGPEKIWSYEIGVKRAFFDRRVIFDGAVYYNEWTDIQQQSAPINGVPVRFTINGGEASGFGTDLSLRVRATDNLTLTGSLGWNGTEYDTVSATHSPGDPLDLVPEYTASLSADYRKPLRDDVEAYLRGDLGYTDGSQATLRNFAGLFPIFAYVDSRTILNAKAGLDMGRYEVYAFGENLTDDNGTTYPPIGTITTPSRGRPLTIGVGANLKF